MTPYIILSQFIYRSKVKGRTSICYAKVNIKYLDNGRRVTDRLLVLSAPSNIVCDVSNSNFAKILRMPSKWHNLPGRTNCSAKTLTHGGRILSAVPSSAQENVGVLLLNLGGPETLSDVQPFLFNLFADPVSQCINVCLTITKVLPMVHLCVWIEP